MGESVSLAVERVLRFASCLWGFRRDGLSSVPRSERVGVDDGGGVKSKALVGVSVICVPHACIQVYMHTTYLTAKGLSDNKRVTSARRQLPVVHFSFGLCVSALSRFRRPTPWRTRRRGCWAPGSCFSWWPACPSLRRCKCAASLRKVLARLQSETKQSGWLLL